MTKYCHMINQVKSNGLEATNLKNLTCVLIESENCMRSRKYSKVEFHHSSNCFLPFCQKELLRQSGKKNVLNRWHLKCEQVARYSFTVQRVPNLSHRSNHSCVLAPIITCELSILLQLLTS